VLSATQANNTRILNVLLSGPTRASEIEKSLLFAVKLGYADCVQCLLKAGANPNLPDVSDNPPLYLAVREGHHEVAEVLCCGGAKVNALGSGNNTPLHVAAKWGKDECLKVLVSHGCCLNARDSYGCTALIIAVRGKHYGAIGFLLEHGCDINCVDHQGRSALHYASQTAVAVDQLIKAGAAVNIQDNDGCTPLLVAATEGLDKVIHSLCQVPGVKVNIPNMPSKKTPLHILAYKGHKSCVQDLIAAGADINLLDCDHRSPLWYAVANSRLDIVTLCLRANGLVDTFQCPADIPNGSCPVKLAVDLGLVDILKLFIISGYDNQHIREHLSHPDVNRLFVNNQILHWLEHAQQVLSLQQICRRWVRHHLGYHLFMDISKLPLPQKILDFITMKELEDMHKSVR
ncbi:serine/threonine-protein phosphatase 6 regulatory ankyrin repeat subunit B, partial [Biomphalaria pfeifferi]